MCCVVDPRIFCVVRVMTKSVKVTRKRVVAEKNLNVAVIGLHSQQQTAKLAREGNNVTNTYVDLYHSELNPEEQI